MSNSNTKALFGPMTAVASLLLGAAIASPVLAGPDDMIALIEVSIDLDEVTNPAAALRYNDIAVDLQAALAARLVDRIAEEGMTVAVDLSEAELSSTFTEVMGSADTRLVGSVNIKDMADNSNYESYELSVDINQGLTYLPADMMIANLSPNSDEYYKAMIETFADVVVAKLNE